MPIMILCCRKQGEEWIVRLFFMSTQHTPESLWVEHLHCRELEVSHISQDSENCIAAVLCDWCGGVVGPLQLCTITSRPPCPITFSFPLSHSLNTFCFFPYLPCLSRGLCPISRLSPLLFASLYNRMQCSSDGPFHFLTRFCSLILMHRFERDPHCKCRWISMC